MKHLFLPYELAVIAKEKGFNEPCLYFFQDEDSLVRLQYGDMCSNESLLEIEGCNFAAPTYQQIVDWLRTKHKVFVGVRLHGNSFAQYYKGYTVEKLNPNNTVEYSERHQYNPAIEDAIEEALKLI